MQPLVTVPGFYPQSNPSDYMHGSCTATSNLASYFTMLQELHYIKFYPVIYKHTTLSPPFKLPSTLRDVRLLFIKGENNVLHPKNCIRRTQTRRHIYHVYLAMGRNLVIQVLFVTHSDAVDHVCYALKVQPTHVRRFMVRNMLTLLTNNWRLNGNRLIRDGG